MPRFLVPPEQIYHRHFVILGSEARHASVVLHKKVGDTIDLFDGKDLSYQGRIEFIDPARVEGVILNEIKVDDSTQRPLLLYQALIKGPKWDWLVEKASELGVSRLVPLETARTIVKPSHASAQERWKRIALAAAKQCGRAGVMEISSPLKLVDAVKSLPKDGLALFPWEKEISQSIRQVFSSQPGREGPVAIFIGPEGGWEDAEVDYAQRYGAFPVKLVHTLLRSETAALAALAMTLSEMGE